MHAHDGGTLGSSSALYVAVDSGLVIVVLANRGMGIAGNFGIARTDPVGLIEEMVATQARS
mgnify:CR=1 FL=1